MLRNREALVRGVHTVHHTYYSTSGAVVLRSGEARRVLFTYRVIYVNKGTSYVFCVCRVTLHNGGRG